MKSNCTIRICEDYKVTINPVSQVDTYPLPMVEELFSALSGGRYFSKLDMSQAYFQLELENDSKRYVTVSTHKGLFQYNRLSFGVSSAPSIFQKCMETLLQGCKGVSVYLDDILVTGGTAEELHESHMGSSKMKSLARTYVWWPKMDTDIVEMSKSCSVCQVHQHSPASTPLHPWEWPETPWSQLHLDFAGPFLGHIHLITVDAPLKWLDVKFVSHHNCQDN